MENRCKHSADLHIRYLDTSGVFTRSIDMLHLVTSKLLEGTSEPGRSPPLSEVIEPATSLLPLASVWLQG